MKRKKGFTLIELLAVIVILAVLVLVAVPSVLKSLDKSRKSAFQTEAASIIEAAKVAYQDQYFVGGNKKCFTLEELKAYIDAKDFTGYNGKVIIGETIDETTINLTNGIYTIKDGKEGSMTVVDNSSLSTEEQSCS